MNKNMKKMYQNPQCEVIKTVACQRLMISVSETPISGGGGNAPMRNPNYLP